MADFERSLKLLKNAKETITVHPHLALPHQGGGNIVVISVPPPPVEGLGGVYCYKKQYTR